MKVQGRLMQTHSLKSTRFLQKELRSGTILSCLEAYLSLLCLAPFLSVAVWMSQDKRFPWQWAVRGWICCSAVSCKTGSKARPWQRATNREVEVSVEIIGEYQCGFRRNRSTVDHIFSIRQILGMKWGYNKDVCQLFIDFEKAYDSAKRESLYDILIESGLPRHLISLIKTCLDDTRSKVRLIATTI